MLESVHSQQDAIQLVLDNKDRADLLVPIDGTVLSTLVDFFKPFHIASRELEVDKRPTFQKVALWMYELLNFFALDEDDDSRLRVLRSCH